MRIFYYMTRIIVLFALSISAQENINYEIISSIKIETIERSQIMETVGYLTDVCGPRLTNSPNYIKASEYCVQKLQEWGAEADLEPWGTFGSGWYTERFNIEMLEPDYMRINAYPKAWSQSTKGTITGEPILVEIDSEEDFDNYRGKLQDAIIMLGKPNLKPNPHFEADASRISDEELQEAEQLFTTEPYKKPKSAQLVNDKYEFFAEQGVQLALYPTQFDHGIVGTSGKYIRTKYSMLYVSNEHYGRLYRLMQRGIPVKLAVSIQNIFNEDSIANNVIAEIPGEDNKLKDEIVMLGAHLDSWAGGTGATDNAASCAVMMEVIRILKAIEIKPRRTIRLALWSGEEQGLLGSKAYVKKHFGDKETMQLLPSHKKLSVYFNLDNGAGKIRGVFLQDNERARPIFTSLLQPFAYLGANTITIYNTFRTDHHSFDEIGLPGFQFIQDPIEYGTRTHHTNMDVYEALLEDDLKQATMVIASMVYHSAMRDKMFPRKELPKIIKDEKP